MPPKGWRKYPDGFKPVNSSGTPVRDKEVYSIDELLLPRTSVVRLAKDVLPGDALLPKDGVTALLRSSTVFISYLAAAANKVAQDANRKAVKPQDVFKALEDINFATFIIPVREDLEKYETFRTNRKNRIAEGAGQVDLTPSEQNVPEEDLISDDEEKDVFAAYATTTSAQAIAKRLKLSDNPTDGLSSADTSTATIPQGDDSNLTVGNDTLGNETIGDETQGNDTIGNDTNTTIPQDDPNETLEEPAETESAAKTESIPITMDNEDEPAEKTASGGAGTEVDTDAEEEDEETANFRQK